MGYEFFGEKIIFPSAMVPGINKDQFLIPVQYSSSGRWPKSAPSFEVPFGTAQALSRG